MPHYFKTMTRNEFLIQLTALPESRYDPHIPMVQKRLLLQLNLIGSGILAVLTFIFFLFGEEEAGYLELLFLTVTLTTYLYFRFTGASYDGILKTQLIFVQIIPFLITLKLGGLVASGGHVLWCFLGPMALLVFKEKINAVWGIVFFLFFLVITTFVGDFFRDRQMLELWQIQTMAFLNFGGLCSLVFMVQRKYTNQIRLERQKSDELLLNILPKHIAKSLKATNRTIANQFDSVTILFADIVNFTQISQTLQPQELVELLNAIFSHFDGLAEKYQLEKIKTIGDCYMVASGVPIPRDDHAESIAKMALEAQHYIKNESFLHGIPIQIRIGVHTGSIVAGVIGHKKFIYDLWGNTVNVAARMEAIGEAGEITITPETYILLKDKFECYPKGNMKVKGVGSIDVWQLVGKW